MYHHQVTVNKQNQLAEHPAGYNETRYDCATPFGGSDCGVEQRFLASDEFFGKQYQPIAVDGNGIVIGQGRSGYTYVVEHLTPSHADYERLSYWESSSHIFGLMANRYAAFGVGTFRDTGGFDRRRADENKTDETIFRAWAFTTGELDLRVGDHDFGTDLSATYKGSMLGITRAQDVSYVHGDATLTVSSIGGSNHGGLGGSYDVDAQFTNIVDTNGNSLADLTLNTVRADNLARSRGNSFGSGSFALTNEFTSNHPAEGLYGSFLLNGAESEDIIGTFYHPRMVGAYGVSRTP